MKPLAGLLALLIAVLLTNSRTDAQALPPASPALLSLSLECSVRQISLSNRSANITCSIVTAAGHTEKVFVRFTDEFAGVTRLSERVHRLQAVDGQRRAVAVEMRGNGLYVINPNSAGLMELSYEMRLAQALDPSQYALVSSLGPDAGIFMTGDLLPRICSGDESCATSNSAVRLQIEAPPGWQIATTEQRQGNVFSLTDPANASFFLGRLRESASSIGEMSVRFAIAGSWAFPDAQVFSLGESIAREQAALVGGKYRGQFLVTLAPFPQPLTGLRSSAITVGRTVVLLLNPDENARQSFGHYRRHLAHELFHFYLPNAFRIRENFDWFWEGFTRYIALLTLARLRLIDLSEFLEAVNAEYEAYLFNPFRQQLSLIAASPEKFASAASYDLVYRKGMLVAALYDLQLRWESRNQSDLSDLMKSLYRKYALTGREVGNREVLQEMQSLGDFKQFVGDDIAGMQPINLAARVKTYGLTLEQNAVTGRWKLKPATKLSSRQQSLLSKLAMDAQ